ncbi:P-loop containing nucleoside triphosphate hydrolase [Sesbania bispinosa]|nr:P-loop containing nucleoside triphosphate hydrolase [Sesbania bispinosa]
MLVVSVPVLNDLDAMKKAWDEFFSFQNRNSRIFDWGNSPIPIPGKRTSTEVVQEWKHTNSSGNESCSTWIGRTGRAGKMGLEAAFFNDSNLSLAKPLADLMQEANQEAIIKPQYVDHIPKAVQGNVGQVLDQKNERYEAELCHDLELNQVIDRNVGDLSGGELQRFAIAVVAIQNAEIYMFDEPSSYLDVKQRLKAAQVTRSLLRPNSYVIVVEHDLSVLDYLSDFICCLYGKPGAYGVVTRLP